VIYFLDTNAVVALLRLSWQVWTPSQRSVRVNRQRVAASLPRLARFVLRVTVLPGRTWEESKQRRSEGEGSGPTTSCHAG
jgi:hypothetical protein